MGWKTLSWRWKKEMARSSRLHGDYNIDPGQFMLQLLHKEEINVYMFYPVFLAFTTAARLISQSIQSPSNRDQSVKV
jgi:hypothetical protein